MARDEGKLLHHRCGYLLRSVVFHRLWDQVVVNYRDPAQKELVVFECPKCRRPLQLWWEVDACEGTQEGVQGPWEVGVVMDDW